METGIEVPSAEVAWSRPGNQTEKMGKTPNGVIWRPKVKVDSGREGEVNAEQKGQVTPAA